MIFRLPIEEDEVLLNEYVQEHYLNNEEEITASDDFTLMRYTDWLGKVNKYKNVFLCFEQEQLIGLLCVRCHLKEQERYIYGDIGYSVRPTQRRRGHATRILNYGLELLKNQNFDYAIIGCFKNNIGSAKTIINNGGILLFESDCYEKGKMSQYYKINLKRLKLNSIVF